MQAEQTRAAVPAAAGRPFAQRGWAGPTMQGVASVAGRADEGREAGRGRRRAQGSAVHAGHNGGQKSQ